MKHANLSTAVFISHLRLLNEAIALIDPGETKSQLIDRRNRFMSERKRWRDNGRVTRSMTTELTSIDLPLIVGESPATVASVMSREEAHAA